MPLRTDLQNFNIQTLMATQKLHLQLQQQQTYMTYVSNMHVMHSADRQSGGTRVISIHYLLKQLDHDFAFFTAI